jgi:pyruvate dehydrogenase E1 component beta subunit
MNQAISAGLADEMRENADVVVFGEDVAVAEGPFKTSAGLLDEFGPSRVRDTPISEMGFLGAGVGAAATGLRPVVEIMFIEFLGVALDQLSTEAAKFHYLSGGQVTVPLTVRASVGAGLGFGTQHSQTLENWLFATPGLKVVVPSSPQTAYGLLRSAVRDNNPVVVLEPRSLYAGRGEVTVGEEGVIPIGEAALRAEGADVTIVALGAMVSTAVGALALARGWSADVIDLQTLIPYDRDAILTSVRKTGRLVTVEESPLTGGWGADIVAFATREAFTDLQAPPLRITCPDVPIPYGKELEERYLPSAEYVAAQVDSLMETGTAPPHWWEAGASTP